mmetsp:Transcript_3186/g.6021  ORF Transcript_3186/g.6021 Transcript_3186/m.6021 type:complete len:533 (-) Transcript_3186:449-2047(-)|eukprot:CAMPEP_0184688202 /NCGR_PEP_ID=MMETSP0312-20130426/28946_1 /TAXON_ID=31354 /ORGANISM="Compsopogon coeruleus, Strain SAG 36.94" /LENGTH=532 /DNA_ID=CAMNT_0027145077 /DNA_START=247 /DNA_END=1845 /DNA_ORIENTATION=+
MGSRIGQYNVTETLGTGTFGKVKLARHSETGERFAIKIVEKSQIVANELTQSVRREISIMRALRHKNIVGLKEVLSSTQKLYIVMELVSGGELGSQVERQGRFPEAIARRYFQQLVDGIAYCHGRGVCHRDLKPENILVDEYGVLKISDFGVSCMMSAETLLYTSCGTPYYAAPEVVSGKRQGYDGQKVDVWSCGIILFFLLTGKLPFRKETMAELCEAIKRNPVVFPSTVSPHARDLISKMLEKDPGRRATIEDIRSHTWFLMGYDSNGNNEVSPRFLEELRNSSLEDQSMKRNWGVKVSAGVARPVSKDGGTSAARTRDMAQRSVSVPRTIPESPPIGRHEVQRSEPDATSPVSSRSSASSRSTSMYGNQKLVCNGPNLSPAHQERAVEEEEREIVREIGPRNLSETSIPNRGSPAHFAISPACPNRRLSNEFSFMQRIPLDLTGRIRNLEDLLQHCLTGKPSPKIDEVAAKLRGIDIDCMEDIQALVETVQYPEEIQHWLMTKGEISYVSSIRICRAFFPDDVKPDQTS